MHSQLLTTLYELENGVQMYGTIAVYLLCIEDCQLSEEIKSVEFKLVNKELRKELVIPASSRNAQYCVAHFSIDNDYFIVEYILMNGFVQFQCTLL